MKRRITLIILAALSVAAMAQSEQRMLMGNLVNSNGRQPIGVYAMPLTSENFSLTPIVTNPEIKADNGGTIVNGQLHFVNRNNDRQYVYHKFDTATWQRIGEPEVMEGDFKVGDIAYDAEADLLWAYFDEEWANGVHTYSRFGYADVNTKDVTILREGDELKREMMAVCIGPDNNVYSMDPLSRIWKVDKTTGEPSVAFRLGMSYWIGESHYSDTRYAMTYDSETNSFYITLIVADDLRSLLMKVDASTGEVSEVGEFNNDEEFGALWIATVSTTGIENAESFATDTDNTIYDIQGRSVEQGKAAHGIYIKNGKKVVIK